LLAKTFAMTPLILGSFFSPAGGGGGFLAAALALLSPAFKPSIAPAKPNVTALKHEPTRQLVSNRKQ